MTKFYIAGLVIGVNAEGPIRKGKFIPFHTNSNEEPDIVINIIGEININEPEGNILFEENCGRIGRFDNSGNFFECLMEYDPDDISFLYEASANWKEITVRYKTDEVNEAYDAIDYFGGTYIRNSILAFQGIVIHSSSILHNGKGILFSAPSETGKTTQANLWCKHKGAQIMNGDRSIIRMINQQPYVFGTPWCGSNADCINKSVPLAAIVMLEQASENSIRQLSFQEAVHYLTPRCLLPYFDESLMSKALANLENIILTTPVYILRCLPNLEAVDLVYEYVNA